MARRLFISGRVQGVGYRAGFAWQARSLALKGWVRNRRDGRVEALVDGEPAALDAILAWAQNGPPAATVIGVEVEDDAGPAGQEFRVLPDA